MRTRIVLLVVAILLVAGFAALNWSEIIRPAPLLFGPVIVDAAMGAILLGLLAFATLVFVLATGAIRTRALMESRQHYKTLEAQRELADKAEASRFTDLRQHLDTQLRELRERDGVHISESHQAMLENQRELRAQLEQINRTLAARLADIEHRLDTRLDRLHVPAQAVPAVTPAMSTPAMAAPMQPPVHRETLHPAAREVEREHAAAQARRDAMPVANPHPVAAERIHQQQMNERRPQGADDKPATQQAGWRRWF